VKLCAQVNLISREKDLTPASKFLPSVPTKKRSERQFDGLGERLVMAISELEAFFPVLFLMRAAQNSVSKGRRRVSSAGVPKPGCAVLDWERNYLLAKCGSFGGEWMATWSLKL
jgi:hypothetical protein